MRARALRLFGCCVCVIAPLIFASSAGAGPIFIRLGTGNIARAVSDDGSVVVGVLGETPSARAFRWTQSGGIQYLGDLPGGYDSSYGLSVSGDGSIVVGSGAIATGSGTEGYRWTAATGLVPLGDLPGGNYYSVATAISSDGSTIVGVSSGSNGTESVRWDGGAAPPIGLGGFVEPNGQAWAASADGSIIVGSDYSNAHGQTGLEAFRWSQATGMVGLGDAPGGGCCSEAYNISPEGSVIVGQAWSGSGILAMRWTQATGISLLGDLPGGESDSLAYSASANGSAIVGVGNTTLGDEAFIWTAESGLRNMQQMIQADLGIPLTGWKLQEARDISPNGTAIVGWGWNPAGQREGWLLIIPEPNTGALVVAGLVGLASWRRRRAYARDRGPAWPSCPR